MAEFIDITLDLSDGSGEYDLIVTDDHGKHVNIGMFINEPGPWDHPVLRIQHNDIEAL